MFRDPETERLFLKSIGHEDDAFFYKQFSSDEMNRYLFDAEPCSSVLEAAEWIAGLYKSGGVPEGKSNAAYDKTVTTVSPESMEGLP